MLPWAGKVGVCSKRSPLDSEAREAFRGGGEVLLRRHERRSRRTALLSRPDGSGEPSYVRNFPAWVTLFLGMCGPCENFQNVERMPFLALTLVRRPGRPRPKLKGIHNRAAPGPGGGVSE